MLDKPRVYGRWSGNPKGSLEEPERCIVGVSGGFPSHQCLRCFGSDGLYCKQHDPDAVKARKEASDAAYKADNDRLWQQDQDRAVGSWMRRYKPEDYKDIVRLLYEQE